MATMDKYEGWGEWYRKKSKQVGHFVQSNMKKLENNTITMENFVNVTSEAFGLKGVGVMFGATLLLRHAKIRENCKNQDLTVLGSEPASLQKKWEEMTVIPPGN